MRPLLNSVMFSSFLMLAACSKGPTIDATSDEALNSSLNALYQTLSTNESEKLRQDMAFVNTYFQRRLFKGQKIEDAQKDFVQMLNGKTPSEIGDLVEALRPYDQQP